MKQRLLILSIIIAFLGYSYVPVKAQQCTGNYLTAQGNKLYDSKGNLVRLTGVNWFGFETSNKAPHGLWSRDCKSMLMQIKDQGFNSVRIPWSNAILAPGATFTGVSSATVPDPYTGRMLNVAEGKLTSPLLLMDLVIQYCQELGLKVILDNHSRNPDGYIAEELWYTANISTQKWIDDWIFMANRYKNFDAVIAMDIDNEPHGKNGNGAQWGTGLASNDWRLAAQSCGNAILNANPKVLIMIEGTEEFQSQTYWWGGNLKGVRNFPVVLSNPAKLVYSPHEYGPTVFPQVWFSDPTFPANMAGIWEAQFNYIITNNISPLFVGEFGIKQTGGLDEVWFDTFLAFMTNHGYSWSFWCWNPNSGDTGGILADDWTSVVGWKMNKLKPHLAAFIPNCNGDPDIPVTGITVSPLSATINGIGGTTTLMATVLPANATNKSVTWSSSNPLVATVSQSGIVTGVALGTATITATSVSGGFTASSAISVTVVIVPVESVTLSPISGNVIIGNNIQLTPNVLPVNATNKAVGFVSSNPLLATVSSTGVVTGVAEGNVTITVTTLDGGKTASSSITILAPSVLTTIAIIPATVTLNMGSTLQFNAIGKDQYGSVMVFSPIWSTTGGTISASGLYTANAKGDFVITAQSGTIIGSALVKVNDVPFYAKIEAESYTAMLGIQTETTTDAGGGKNVGWINNGDWMTYSITVPQAGIYAANFRVAGWQSTGKIELQNAANTKLTAVTIPNTGGYQKWATAPGENNFTLAAGTQTIRIYAAGAPWNLNWFEIKSVAIPVLTSIKVTPANASVMIGSSVDFNAQGFDQFGNTMAITETWAVSGGGSINISGLFTGSVVGGPYTVSASASGITGTGTVSVTAPQVLTSITITPNPITINSGISQQFIAVGRDQNGVIMPFTPIWSATGGSISSTGLYSAGNTSGIFAVTAASGNITGISDVTIVGPVIPTSVSVIPASLNLGIGLSSTLTTEVLPVNATNKSVSWLSSNPLIATVNSAGVVTGIAEGSAIITATTVSGGLTATSAITVTTIPVTGVTVSPTALSVNVGSTSPLIATVSPANATNKIISWSSSNPAIASVSNAGIVSGIIAGSAIITATTVNGGFTATCAVTVIGNNCTFGTPIATALPTISNKSFSHAYVVGTGGPNLSNVTNFTINWDLANNGLWQFSMNTSNGIPGWWIDLLPKITKNFNVTSPSCKIAGSGITGLDNDYWVNYDGTIFVLVAKSGNYAIVGSNSATAPACNTLKEAEFAVSKEGIKESLFSVYPNPIEQGSSLIVTFENAPENSSIIIVSDLSGRSVLRLSVNENLISLPIDNKFRSGIYNLQIISNSEVYNDRFVVK
jgi:endoglucanase